MFFGIPTELISLSTTLFCLVFISLVPLGITMVYLFNSIFKGIHLLTHKYPKVDCFANNWSVWIVISIVYLAALANMAWTSVLMFIFILLVILIVFDLLIRPALEKANKELDKSNNHRFSLLRLDELLTRFEKKVGINMNKLLSFVFLVFLSTFLFGISTGSRTQMFMVTTNIPTKIVLRTYNGYMILTDFNHETKEVGNEFVLQQIGQSQNAFKWEVIGKVKPLGNIFSFPSN